MKYRVQSISHSGNHQPFECGTCGNLEAAIALANVEAQAERGGVCSLRVVDEDDVIHHVVESKRLQ